METTPTILMIAAGILFIVGGVVLFKKETHWSDGTRIQSRQSAEENIINWANQTRRQYIGGKKNKTLKHYG
jgi:hypothetical protein